MAARGPCVILVPPHSSGALAGHSQCVEVLGWRRDRTNESSHIRAACCLLMLDCTGCGLRGLAS
eukprot:12748571-Alexandrium_andersonii.AAC.1